MPTSPANATRPDFGVLYLVDDNPGFHQMLAVSLESLRRFHPDWPVRVIHVPSRPHPVWRRAYRRLSFWKQARRRARFGQDTGIIARKAEAILATPFTTTLYLDVDTVILRPLDDFRERARQADVLATPLPWKHFQARANWQPARWPYLMTGVFFYSPAFVSAFDQFLRERFPLGIADIPMTDMFVISLLCHLQRDALRIVADSRLQLDVLNLAPLLGRSDFPRRDGLLDLAWDGLQPFGMFHYNEHKPDYLHRACETWGLTGKQGLLTAELVDL